MAGGTNYIRCLYSVIFAFQKTARMNYTVEIKVMPLKELLDPQGKAVLGGLGNLGMNSIDDVRIGKHINLQVEAGSPEEAKLIAEEASKKLLANPVMEYFEISVV
jgi:phosphoribosylformylglycinamidine synthase